MVLMVQGVNSLTREPLRSFQIHASYTDSEPMPTLATIVFLEPLFSAT